LLIHSSQSYLDDCLPDSQRPTYFYLVFV
jgi:hypothetical protein